MVPEDEQKEMVEGNKKEKRAEKKSFPEKKSPFRSPLLAMTGLAGRQAGRQLVYLLRTTYGSSKTFPFLVSLLFYCAVKTTISR